MRELLSGNEALAHHLSDQGDAEHKRLERRAAAARPAYRGDADYCGDREQRDGPPVSAHQIAQTEEQPCRHGQRRILLLQQRRDLWNHHP